MDKQHRSQILITQDAILPGVVKERHLVAGATGAKGDIVYGDGKGNFNSLAIGKTNQFLGIAAGFPVWSSLFTDLSQPYTIQFGTTSISLVATTTGNKAVTFATAYTNACSIILVNVNNSTNDPSTYTVNTKSVAKTGFTVYITSSTSTTDTITIAYFAIGY